MERTREEHERQYISVEEASEKTGVPKLRIINQIRNETINGFVFMTVDGPSGMIRKEELHNLK